MIALIKISQFLYFLIFMVFLVFIFIYQGSTDTSTHSSIILLFTFLLLPLFDTLLNILKQDVNIHKGLLNKKNIFSTSLYLGAILGLFLFGKMTFVALLLVSLIYFAYAKIEGKIFFVCALGVFCYAGFYLLVGQSGEAEKLSIIAYYLLIAGVVSQILENIISSKTKI